MATSISFQQFPAFDTDEDIQNIGICRFETFLQAMNVTSEARKRALLLHYGGFPLQDIGDSLDNAGTTYKELVDALTSHFEPSTNTNYEVWNFQKTIQNQDEPCQSYYIRLKEIATRCKFTDINAAIKTQLILGTCSAELRNYSFTHKDATITDILTHGKLMENVKFQTTKMKETKTEKLFENDTSVEVVHGYLDIHE